MNGSSNLKNHKPVKKKLRSKSELTRERLLKAAAKVVGSLGYEKASIAKISEEAGIAAGGFYYYFSTRRDLFDELLPSLGRQMVSYVAAQIRPLPMGVDREVAAFTAYLEYLRDNPEFYRVFSEAQVYAPEAYKKNFLMTIKDFSLSLSVQRSKGFLHADEDEIMILTYFLTGIRNYISQLYMMDENRLDGEMAYDSIKQASSIYRKLIVNGIFRQ